MKKLGLLVQQYVLEQYHREGMTDEEYQMGMKEFERLMKFYKFVWHKKDNP